MHVDPPAGSWKDGRRSGESVAQRLDAAKAANSLSAAKAGSSAYRQPGDSRPDDRRPDDRRPKSSPARTAPRLELSLTQILGSTAAAVTAAFLGSRLGVAGTLIGAALASVISVVGGALYTTSLKATRHRMSKVLLGRADGDGAAVDGRGPGGAPAPLLPIRPPARRHDTGTRTTPAPAWPARTPAWPVSGPAAPERRTRPALRGACVGVLLSAAVFGGALVVVTGVESVAGTALSGGSAGSLTILGGNDVGGGRDDRPDPTPASATSPVPSTASGTPGSTSSAAATTDAGPSNATTGATTSGTSSGTTSGSSAPATSSGTTFGTSTPATAPDISAPGTSVSGTSTEAGTGPTSASTGAPTTGSSPAATPTTSRSLSTAPSTGAASTPAPTASAGNDVISGSGSPAGSGTTAADSTPVGGE